jgi:hypothetical protein
VIVSVMQPYFFPYIGYFQLLAQSDVFVFSDDVQYIKGGWVNRNRILLQGKPAWLGLPVLYGPHRLAIRHRQYQLEPATVRRCKRQIQAAYERAPYFGTVFPLLGEILEYPVADVASFNINLIRRVAERIGITTRCVVASDLGIGPGLAGQELVIDICRRLRATRYVNPIGGTKLYQASRFARDGIELGFLRSTVPAYPQFAEEPVTCLSMIDVLMFNTPQAIRELMRHYSIDANPDGAGLQATGMPGALPGRTGV